MLTAAHTLQAVLVPVLILSCHRVTNPRGQGADQTGQEKTTASDNLGASSGEARVSSRRAIHKLVAHPVRLLADIGEAAEQTSRRLAEERRGVRARVGLAKCDGQV